ncbi:MAG: phosphotransferase [Myxococcales bacterium]|nr:MAG: phosphotransferase [Myxococcales bacterium]
MSGALSSEMLSTSLLDLGWTGVAVKQIVALKGDASSRRYYRVSLEGGAEAVPASIIVMQLPAMDVKAEEVSSGPVPSELPFIDVTRLMQKRGLPVPQLVHINKAEGLLLLEDLGDTTLEAQLSKSPRDQWATIYKEVITLLLRMHDKLREADSGSIAYQRSFSPELLHWELEHFREWGLEALHGPLPPPAKETFDAISRQIVDRISQIPQGFCHRDYQSRNLMHCPDREPEPWVILDFQDALLGPRVYDLVALLADSYIPLTMDEQLSLLKEATGQLGLDAIAAKCYEEDFWWMCVQRKLKDAGRFIFIDRVKKNPTFLPYYEPSLTKVKAALTQIPELAKLEQFLQKYLPNYPR